MSDTVQQFWVNFAGTGDPNVQAPGAGAQYGAAASAGDVTWPTFLSKKGSTVAHTLLMARGADGVAALTAADDWRTDAFTYFAQTSGFEPKVGPGAVPSAAWPAGAIVGLVLGILVVLIIPAAVVALVIYIIQRRKQAAAGDAPSASTSLLGGATVASETSYGVVADTDETA